MRLARPLDGLRRSAPGAGLGAPGLDELLEALEVALGLLVDEAELVADLLDDPLGLHVELQEHPGAGALGLERDGAGVRRAIEAPPGDALVGRLVDDLGVPFTTSTGDLGHPVQPLVVELGDALDALHEVGEVFELRPLVVNGGDRTIDDDGLLVVGHGATPHESVRDSPDSRPASRSACRPDHRSVADAAAALPRA